MIEDVVHRQAETKLNAVAVELEVDRILQLGVEREEGRETSRLVLRTEILPVLVESGEGKSGVHVEDGDKVEFVGKRKNSPEQAAIWCVR